MYSDSMVLVFPLRSRLSSTGKCFAPSILMRRMLIQMYSDSLVLAFPLRPRLFSTRQALRALYLHAPYAYPNAVILWC